MEKFYTEKIVKSERITRLVDNLFKKMPEVEAARAVLITQSYMQTENEPMVTRRAKAFEHILDNIPIIIRDEELIVGSSTIAPRGCQTYPEFSYQWLIDEFDLEHDSIDVRYVYDKEGVCLFFVKELKCYSNSKTEERAGIFYLNTMFKGVKRGYMKSNFLDELYSDSPNSKS